jgi:hypothetical protein
MNALQNLLGHDSGQLTAWIPIMVILAVVVPFYRMMRASTELRDRAEDAIKANSGANLTLAVKGSARESLVIRLNKDALQKASDLLRVGNDLESVCREIEPEYPNWRIVQQQAFRRAIEMVLKAEPTAQNSPQIASTQPR